MKAEDKTKELPIDELVELRQRIAQLEKAQTERKQGEEDRKKAQTYLQSGLARTPEGTSLLEVL
jgi:hypothetical protein